MKKILMLLALAFVLVATPVMAQQSGQITDNQTTGDNGLDVNTGADEQAIDDGPVVSVDVIDRGATEPQGSDTATSTNN